MQRLWDWADKNNVSDLEWIKNSNYSEGGYWNGLPRNKDKLTKLAELHLWDNQLTSLPPEIGKLTNLTHIDLSGNPLKLGFLGFGAEIDRIKRLLPYREVKFE